VHVTAKNHRYAVDADTLGGKLGVNHINGVNALLSDEQTFFVKPLQEYLTPEGKGGRKKVLS
jgi:hypothetical protein